MRDVCEYCGCRADLDPAAPSSAPGWDTVAEAHRQTPTFLTT